MVGQGLQVRLDPLDIQAQQEKEDLMDEMELLGVRGQKE